MHTGLTHSIPDVIKSKLENIAPSFEEYLPDEKISRKWEEVEVISSENPDFETVFFRYDLDNVLILVSTDFEFFPVYALSRFQELGWPHFAHTGEFGENEFIGIDERQDVIVFGLSNPEMKDKLSEILPTVSNKVPITSENVNNWIMDVFEDL